MWCLLEDGTYSKLLVNGAVFIWGMALDWWNMVFWIKSAVVLKKHFIANHSTMKNIVWKNNAGFYDNEIPEKGFNYISLWMILVDSVLKKGKNYYP